MAQSQLELWNIAIASIGTRSRIGDVNEVSREAEQLRLNYDSIRRVVFSAAPWGSCAGAKALPLLAERDTNLDWQEGDPEPGWLFRYGLPTDFIYPRWLTTYEKFEMATYGDQRTILCDNPAPILRYTRDITNLALLEPPLYLALALGLGAAVCQNLTGKTKLGQDAQARANEIILSARLASGNEAPVPTEGIPEWMSARGASYASFGTRFVYPVGNLLSVVSSSTTVTSSMPLNAS